MSMIDKLLDKINKYRKKKEDLTDEYNEKLRKGKSVNVEFQKKRSYIDGKLLAYKDSLIIIKENNGSND